VGGSRPVMGFNFNRLLLDFQRFLMTLNPFFTFCAKKSTFKLSAEKSTFALSAEN
jgi:hypothetical protein